MYAILTKKNILLVFFFFIILLYFVELEVTFKPETTSALALNPHQT
jgi:hypothetical protein